MNYQETTIWRGKKEKTLKDIIKEDLDVLFICINPAKVSVEAGHYFQGKLGEQFWKILVSNGIIPAPAKGKYHDELLLDFNIGIADIVKKATAREHELDEEDYKIGKKLLLEKVKRYLPEILCLQKKAAEKLFPGYDVKNKWGFIQDLKISNSRIFILPFPYRKDSLVKERMGELKKELNKI